LPKIPYFGNIDLKINLIYNNRMNNN